MSRSPATAARAVTAVTAAIGRRPLLAALAGAACASATGPATAALDLPDLIAAARPSIVAVGTYNALDTPRFTFRGTGFVVGNGTRVITNAHVLPGPDLPAAARLVVMLPQPDGSLTQLRDATAREVVADHDLALVEIGGTPLPPLTLADGALVRDGLSVALIGFPLGASLGLTPVTHRGIVSAVTPIALPAPTGRQLDARTVARLRSGPFQIYQLDATAYPGNSGSPLFDAATGQVVGIINMVLVKGTRESAISVPTGITYAIPVRYIHALLQGR